MPWQKLEVGKPHPTLTPPLPEGAWFNWQEAGLELLGRPTRREAEVVRVGAALELLLAFGRPTRREVEAVRVGAAEFALVPAGLPLFLLYRFGEGIPWSDAPYTPHLQPEARRPDTVTFTTAQTRLPLQVVLVESPTAVVRVLRAVPLSPAFSRALAEAVQAQLVARWPGRAEYDRQLAAAYRRWPDAEAMLADATARTQGGA
jgi:hypothetical protein